MVLRDEPIAGINDCPGNDVFDIPHRIDPADLCRQITQAPSDRHPTEIGKALGKVDRRRHREVESSNAVIANLTLEPRPDVIYDILMQTVRGAAACEKDGDIIPKLPGLGTRVPSAFGLPDDRLEACVGTVRRTRTPSCPW